MGDEKVPADVKKDDKPPAVTKPPGPEQQTGPGRAEEKKPKDEKKPDEKKPEEKKPAAGAVPEPSTPPKQAAEQATQLQQSVGNQEANRLMRAARDAPGAPALPVSHPDDKAEKEADALAKKVTEEHPAHPHDNPAPAPGDPKATHGDPHEVTGDPEQDRGTIHRAARKTPQAPTPPPAGGQTKGPKADSPTAALENPGPGEKIPQPTRGILERRLNVNLNHVVIHHDAKADAAVRALHARAVTRGNHIWLASDASPTDLNLMAHEVAHVLQHDNHVVHRKATGQVDLATPDKPTMDIDSIPVPNIKQAWTQDVTKNGPLITRTGETRSTQQVPTWKKSVKGGGLEAKLNERLKKKDAEKLTVDGAEVYYFHPKKAPEHYVFGDKPALLDEIARPTWDKDGTATNFDVDHKLEYQLGGDDETPKDNLWLLEASANRSAGSKTKNTINNAVKDVLDAERTKGKAVVANENEARSKYVVRVKGVTGGLQIAGRPNANWDTAQIGTKGEQLDALEGMNAEQVAKAGLRGEPDKLTIFITRSKRGIKRVDWRPEMTEKEYEQPVKDFLFKTKFDLKKIEWQHGKGGKAHGTLFPKKKKNEPITPKDVEFTIEKYPGIEWGGRLGGVKEAVAEGLDVTGASPLVFDEASLVDGEGIVAKGKLLPTIPLISKLDIDVVLDGDGLQLERTFTADELPVPKPFKVNQSSLTLFAGTNGIGAKGEVDFEIERAAHGQLKGNVGKDGFELTGNLVFDKKLFEEAELNFSYRKKGDEFQWGLGGALTIGPKQVPGVKKATIKAKYEQERFSASGDADLEVPGLEKGTLDVAYSEKEGFSLGGSFQLSKDIPGIKSGEIAATVAKKPDNKWSLSAKGTAQPKIPGVDATLSASYEDGIFTIEGQAAYAKGKLSGTLQVGVTNKPIDPEGKPGEGKPGKELRAYGGGTVTIKVTPWLQGTVGIVLKPEGGIKLSGEIALPDAIDLFPRKEINKNVFEIGVDIPIIGVAVAGQRVGIFATVKGGLDAFAGVGPGQLRDLGLKIEYDPDHEEDTTITGRAKLAVPANAGIRLYVKGGVGLGIPIVSAEAGLEVGGSLALEGAVEAGVTVNWSPAKGLKIDAEASVHAEPKLKFDVSAYVKVEADLLLTSVTLYENNWKLAAVEYGSGLRVGVRAPVHYEEGKPFDFDASKVEFEVPKIDPLAVIGGLVKQITGG